MLLAQYKSILSKSRHTIFVGILSLPNCNFLFLYQILKFISKSAGALLPVIGVLLLILLPFIDRKPDSNRKIYRIRFVIATIGVIAVIALTIWGEIS